jgi:hypothetical protein
MSENPFTNLVDQFKGGPYSGANTGTRAIVRRPSGSLNEADNINPTAKRLTTQQEVAQNAEERRRQELALGIGLLPGDMNKELNIDPLPTRDVATLFEPQPVLQEVDKVKEQIAKRNLENPAQNTAGSVVNAVSDASNLGTAYGTDTANSQKEEGMLSGLVGGVTTLLGNIDTDRLLRIMTNPALQQGSMGPEANVGQNFIRRLVEANYNVNQEDALAAQTGQTNNLAAYKAETDRIGKQATTSPKFSSEIIKLYKQNESYGQSLNAIANAKTYINGAYAGVAGDAKGALVGMARFFGADIEMTKSESIEDVANRVKAQIIGSGMFGRETSSKELKLLDKLVLQISTLKGKDQVLNSFEQLTKTFQGNMQLNTDLLRAAGFQSRSDMARPGGLISKRGD